MKVKNYLILLFSLLSLKAVAQEKGARLLSSNINDIYFYKYEESFKIKAELVSQSDAKNLFPEQLLQSILSSTNYDWDIYNTLGGKDKAKPKSDKHYQKVKTMDKSLNYFELKHKLEFDIEGIPTAIIKYDMVFEGQTEIMSAVIVMQKYDGRWQKTSTKMINDLAMIVWRLKTIEFEKILLAKADNTFLKALIDIVFVNGKIDFIKLNKEIESWYSNDSVENKAKLNYFKDPKTLF